MSQIPRRTTLSMTQPPKARKTPTATPTASQPMQFKRQETDSPRTTKSIDVDAPIVIEDADFGDSIGNTDLIQMLSHAEEKNALNGKTVREEATPQTTATPASPTNGSSKAKDPAKRSKTSKKPSAHSEGAAVQDASGGGDDTQSSSTSVRSSLDSAAPVEMDSLLIPEDDEVVVGAAAKDKSTSSFDSPRPNKTPGKVVRLAKGLRISPFRKASDQQLDNVSTIVNLSTVSEQSVENHLDSPAAVTPQNGDAPGEHQEGDQGAGSAVVVVADEDNSNGGVTEATGGSSRRISARRTFATNRPLREMSFRNATREAYKRVGGGTPEESSNEAVNDSVNATVGSELGFNMDDLPETPAAGIKRRRDSSDVEDETAPQPKKSLFQTYCAIM